MPSQLVVRVDPDLKEKLSRIARSEGRNVSQVVRDLLEKYVEERDLGGYIDDLWNRIGAKIEKKGFTPADVDRIISEVRRGS